MKRCCCIQHVSLPLAGWYDNDGHHHGYDDRNAFCIGICG